MLYYYNNYIIFSLVVLILNRIAGLYTNIRGETLLQTPYKKLPDIIQDNIPKINTNIPDYILGVCILYSIFYNNGNFNVCYESLLLSLMLRPIFVSVTTLPTCMPQPKPNQSLYSKFFNSTHDLIFSGHTCVFLFCGKYISGYIGIIIQYILPISLIASRQHYTIDVLVGLVIYNSIYYNKTLNNWDVSNVRDMSDMFYGAMSFNQPLNNWNVSNVRDMSNMFNNASDFNQPLNNWDVSNVESMYSMFSGATRFNHPLNNWDVSNVKYMYDMFYDAVSFNKSLNNWNVSNRTETREMFFNSNIWNNNILPKWYRV